MQNRFLIAAFALCLTATAQQTLSVNDLSKFIHSSTHELKGKLSDKEIADYLGKVKMRERLDDAMVEQLQGEGIGARTLAALNALRDRSANLPVAKPVAPVAPPKSATAPSNEEQGRILDAVREYAMSYSDRLPNFICLEVTTQFAGPPSGGLSKVAELSSSLTYYEKKEKYTPRFMNGRITNADYDKIPGARSVGDFGSMMRGIFDPATQARFDWEKWDHYGDGRTVMDFSYKISRETSNYEIFGPAGRNVVTAYRGRVMVDPKTNAVLHIDVIAEDLPSDFPIKTAVSALDYEMVDLSGKEFLLPRNVQISMTAVDGQSRLEKRFANYRKYSSEATITFDDPATPPPPVVKKK